MKKEREENKQSYHSSTGDLAHIKSKKQGQDVLTFYSALSTLGFPGPFPQVGFLVRWVLRTWDRSCRGSSGALPPVCQRLWLLWGWNTSTKW